MTVSIRDGRMKSGKLKSEAKPRSAKLDRAFKFNEVQQTSHLKYMFVPLGFGGLDRVGKWDTETAGEKLFP